MPLETFEFDAAEFLNSDEDFQHFMAAAFESDDPAHIARCLGIVARAQNMSKLARDIGMSRPALYKALSGEGNPEFATIMKVTKALGLELKPVIASPSDTKSDTAEQKTEDAA
jgi:probable addiction module antidote protein